MPHHATPSPRSRPPGRGRPISEVAWKCPSNAPSTDDPHPSTDDRHVERMCRTVADGRVEARCLQLRTRVRLDRCEQVRRVVGDTVDQWRHLAHRKCRGHTCARWPEQLRSCRVIGIQPGVPVLERHDQRHPMMHIRQSADGVGRERTAPLCARRRDAGRAAGPTGRRPGAGPGLFCSAGTLARRASGPRLPPGARLSGTEVGGGQVQQSSVTGKRKKLVGGTGKPGGGAQAAPSSRALD